MMDDRLETEIKRHTDWQPKNWYEYYYHKIEDGLSLPEVKTKEEALEALEELSDYYLKAYYEIKDMPDDDWEEE